MNFELHPAALAYSDSLFVGPLVPPPLTGFGRLCLDDYGGSATHFMTVQHREIYSDAVHEMAALIDEIRFEVALAAALIVDFDECVVAGHATANEPEPLDLFGEGEIAVPMPVEITATLIGYHAPLPPPSRFLVDRHTHVAGHRVLSTWVAAQLLDSAFYRCIAVMDRLVILLWCVAGEQINTERYPSYTEAQLKRLARTFGTQQAWTSFAGALDHPLFVAVKSFRDAFTHRRRGSFEGHGVVNAAYSDVAVKPASRHDHLAYLLATFDLVLRGAVLDCRRLLGVDADV